MVTLLTAACIAYMRRRRSSPPREGKCAVENGAPLGRSDVVSCAVAGKASIPRYQRAPLLFFLTLPRRNNRGINRGNLPRLRSCAVPGAVRLNEIIKKSFRILQSCKKG